MTENSSNSLRVLSSKKLFRLFFQALLAAVSGLILYRLIAANLTELSQVRLQVSPGGLLGAFLIYGITAFVSALVWGQMMNSFGKPLPMRTHITIYLAPIFAGRLPGGIWHIVGRVAWYEKYGVSKRITAFTSALQIITVVWSGCIVALGTIPLSASMSRENTLIIGVTTLVLFGLINPKTIGFILRRIVRVEIIKTLRYTQILLWTVVYIFIWMLGGTILYLIILSLYPAGSTAWFASLGAWSLGGISGTLITVLPAGLGLTEVTIGLILANSIPASIAVVAAIIMRIALTSFEFILSGTTYLLTRKSGPQA
jgi:uncharacterized membrane protein YbhN (UPF0104 family)